MFWKTTPCCQYYRAPTFLSSLKSQLTYSFCCGGRFSVTWNFMNQPTCNLFLRYWMYRCIRITINNTNPANNSITRTTNQANPSLEFACLINSPIIKRFPTVENTCPNRLIKLTCQKLKKIERVIALIPKINWNTSGRNKRTIITNLIMSFLFYTLSINLFWVMI